MAKEKPGSLQVKTFADHHVITQPNPLRKVLLRVPESDLDDPVVIKKPVLKRAVVEDRKGRRVLVQRSGSDEARARNELEASGYGPPRRPKRGYHGKRDIKPRDE